MGSNPIARSGGKYDCGAGCTRTAPRVLRAWLSGRASPCQGESRGFESHRPLCLAEVAQLVEHVTENDGVPSSSLGLGTWVYPSRFGDRLTVGQGTLDPCIEVRILVPEPRATGGGEAGGWFPTHLALLVPLDSGVSIREAWWP